MRRSSRYTAVSWAIICLVGAHAVVGLLHGISHVELGVVPSGADIAFIVVVIGIVPIGMLPFVLRGSRVGVGLFAIAFAASWLYGMVNHFVIEGADHIPGMEHGAWQAMFTVTGAMILGLEVAGTLLAVWLFWQASASSLRDAPRCKSAGVRAHNQVASNCGLVSRWASRQARETPGRCRRSSLRAPRRS